MNPVRNVLGRRVCGLLLIYTAGLLSGCTGLTNGANVHGVDWQRVNAIESNARKNGAQIIWLRYPETHPAENAIAPKAAEKVEKEN